MRLWITGEIFIIFREELEGLLNTALAMAKKWGRDKEEVKRVELVVSQIRDCMDQQQEQLNRLQRLLHQLRILLRRTLYRQAQQSFK
jgi:hypothetical protein